MYCEKCGTELINGICPKCTQSETQSVSKAESKFRKFFMSPNEKLVAVLGNSYVENFFQNGSISKGFSVVSDKRAYFQGNSYYISYNDKGRKIVVKNSQSRTVDLQDVTGTGTGTDNYAQVGWKILCIIIPVVFLLVAMVLMFFYILFANPSSGSSSGGNTAFWFGILIIAEIYCFFMYQRSKTSLITIQYAGGEIGFDKKWFTDQEIQLFQKQIRLAKDKAIEASDNAVANRLQEAVSAMAQSTISQNNSVADELSKLADLLSTGVITQEEFDKMKRELI